MEKERAGAAEWRCTGAGVGGRSESGVTGAAGGGGWGRAVAADLRPWGQVRAAGTRPEASEPVHEGRCTKAGEEGGTGTGQTRGSPGTIGAWGPVGGSDRAW